MHFTDTISSRDAKNQFGHLLTTVQRAPVEIQKHGNAVAVLVSAEEYSRLEEMEDAFWLNYAMLAKEGGFVGEKKSEALMAEILGESR
jgi:prevent-host-death family protein